MYGSLPYSAAWKLVKIPYLVSSTLVFVVIFYFMVGYEISAEVFFLDWATLLLYVTVSTFFGQMCTALLPSQQAASGFANVWVSIFTLFWGFLIASRDVAPFWKFLA